jgi:hypothetical protein
VANKVPPSLWLGAGITWINLASLFTQDIISGNNLKKKELRSATIREHLDALNELFEDRGFDPPIDLTNKSSGAGLFFQNVKTWENVPNRRTHITPEFLDELTKRAKQDKDGLGFTSSILDWTLLGRFTGHRLGEFAQETQKRIEYHVSPRKRYLKANSRSCFVFKDKRGHSIKDPVKNKHRVHAVTIMWLVQKNRRNGQKITWIVTNNKLCPVMAAIRIYERSIRLGLNDDEPMGAFFERKRRRFLTGSKIRTYFQAVARHVYPDISDEELSKFSAHMIRVSAAVLLQVSGQPGHFIQKRLRWEGDSYRVYLRNSDALAKLHNTAAAKSASLEYSLSRENLDIDPFFDPPIPAPISVSEMGEF